MKTLLALALIITIATSALADNIKRLGVETIKGILVEASSDSNRTMVVVQKGKIFQAVEIVPPLPSIKVQSLQFKIGEPYSIDAVHGSGTYAYKGNQLMLYRFDRSE